MTMSALIVVQFAEMVVGLTANERFKAVRNLDSGGGIMTSRWFTAAMVAVLVGSIIALVIVGLCRKAAEIKTAEKSLSSSSAKYGLSDSEIDILMAIAIKAGLRQSEDIFNMGEAFERGAAKLLEESRLAGRATTETGQLEKQLADLRAKLGYRKASSADGGQKRENTPANGIQGQGGQKTEARGQKAEDRNEVRGTAFIALYPFAKELGPANGEQQLPQFTPAKVIDAVGRVVSVETTLSANVGDRVLVMIESQSVSDGTRVRELIEDIGVVQRSVQPAVSIDAPNGRRLAIEIAGLSETQATQLAGIVGAAKAKQTRLDEASSRGRATGPKEQS